MYQFYVEETIEKAMSSDSFVSGIDDFLIKISQHPERALLQECALRTMELLIETAKRAGIEFQGDDRLKDSPAARFVRLTGGNYAEGYASEFDVLVQAMDELRRLGCRVEYPHTSISRLPSKKCNEEVGAGRNQMLSLRQCRVSGSACRRDIDTLLPVPTVPNLH